MKYFVFFLALSQPVSAQDLHIYGGPGHDAYLGCFNCPEFSQEAICNEFGKGSEFSPDGIFNEFGTYGSEFSSSSPWNEFSSGNDVPVLVDKNGNFYGYFTINEFRSDAVEFSGNLKKIHAMANGDLTVVRSILCEALQ